VTEGRAAPPPGKWQSATVVQIRRETATAKTFRLELAEPADHLAGQHYVLRLTAPDGYTASRSYSVASAPDGSNGIELTVERLPDGEVSSFLHDEVVVGDELEVRGPSEVGSYAWGRSRPSPRRWIGRGAPHGHAAAGAPDGSLGSRSSHRVHSQSEDLYYAAELTRLGAEILYTRRTPEGWPRPAGRLTMADLPASIGAETTVFVCGSSGFADAATDMLLSAGVGNERIRVERFGPTG